MAKSAMKHGWRKPTLFELIKQLFRPTEGRPRPSRQGQEAGMSTFTPDFDITDKSELTDGGRISTHWDTAGRD